MKVREAGIPLMLAVVLIFAMMGALMLEVMTEPVIPDELDCEARGKPACWRSIYDERGRRVR